MPRAEALPPYLTLVLLTQSAKMLSTSRQRRSKSTCGLPSSAKPEQRRLTDLPGPGRRGRGTRQSSSISGTAQGLCSVSCRPPPTGCCGWSCPTAAVFSELTSRSSRACSVPPASVSYSIGSVPGASTVPTRLCQAVIRFRSWVESMRIGALPSASPGGGRFTTYGASGELFEAWQGRFIRMLYRRSRRGCNNRR